MSVPKTGPGSVIEPLVLNGPMMKCPKCEGTTNLWRNETVPRMIGIKPLPEGGFDWDNEARDEFIDEASVKSSEEPEFFCRDCDVYFEAPEIAEMDGNADRKGHDGHAQVHQGA